MNSCHFCLWVNRRVCSAVITSAVKNAVKRSWLVVVSMTSGLRTFWKYILGIQAHREPHTYIYTLRHIQTHVHKQKSKQTHIYQTHINNHTPKPHTLQSTRISNRPRPSIIYIRVCLLLCHRLFGWSKPIRTTKDFCVRLHMYIAAALEWAKLWVHIGRWETLSDPSSLAIERGYWKRKRKRKKSFIYWLNGYEPVVVFWLRCVLLKIAWAVAEEQMNEGNVGEMQVAGMPFSR